MIKAICFDLDGSYFTPHGKQSFQSKLIELGLPEQRVRHAIYRSNEIFRFVRGDMAEKDYWDYLNMYLDTKLTIEEFEALLVADYSLDKNVKELVEITRKNGYITCICSNNFPTRVRALENKYSFLDDFDVKIFSYEVGYAKPSKKIYQLLLDAAEVSPHEMIISDDNPLRMQGAQEIGINTLVYLTFTQFKTNLLDMGIDLKS